MQSWSAQIGAASRWQCTSAIILYDRPRYGIEQREQQQSRKEPANMGLPCDALRTGANRNRAEARHDIEAKPDRKEAKYARALQ